MHLCRIELELLQFYSYSVYILFLHSDPLEIMDFGSNQENPSLTHINQASFVWDIDKVCRQSLKIMYIPFIRPLLEYRVSVWENATTESKQQLDAIHIEAAIIITGATRLCSIALLSSDIGWESYQDRQTINIKLSYFTKSPMVLHPHISQILSLH